jgi:hypothetical protein
MHQFFLLTLAALASASPQFGASTGAKTGGTGKYGPVSYAVSPQFPGYTVYVPPKAADEKLPVILWANGMCSDDGAGFSSFLLEVSSHGYIIIANGEPGSGMSKQAGQDKMKKALEMVDKQAGTGVLANADKSRIAAAGQSCGGMNAYLMANEPRIKCIGIFDGAKGAAKFNSPVGFFVGGSSDMAWSQVSRRHFVLHRYANLYKNRLRLLGKVLMHRLKLSWSITPREVICKISFPPTVD